MDRCPICTASIDHAIVICSTCGEELPLRVVIVSEGSRGGHFGVVREAATSPPDDAMVSEEEVHGQCDDGT